METFFIKDEFLIILRMDEWSTSMVPWYQEHRSID
jgi:hypothetical protein